jgi:hypothetical protein
MKPDTSFVLKSGHFHLLTTPAIVPLWLMLKAKVPWPALVPAPGALKVMLDSAAIAERPSPTVARARQTTRATFLRAGAAALAVAGLHILVWAFMFLLLSKEWVEDVERILVVCRELHSALGLKVNATICARRAIQPVAIRPL